jgi:glycosyltransferase involved in cell wall biosynthesis
MKIAFDASAVRGFRTGVEHYALRMIEALRRTEGVEVLAFSDRPVPEDPGVRVHRSRLPLALWRQLVLPDLIVRSGCASLHSPITALPLGAGVPAVATVHDLAWKIEPDCYGLRERLVQRFWLNRAAARASRLVCVSEATRSDLIAALPAAAAKAVTVPSGAVAAKLVPPDEAAVERALRKFGLSSRFVLAVGRVERRKNPVHILRAFAKAAAGPDLADVALVFAGAPGNALGEARAEARALGLGPRAVFCSHVGEDLAALYQAAELLVYASRHEGFGHPPFEAISLGTPVVAADLRATRETLGDGGELVPPGDVEALAGAIRRVLSDPALAGQLLARGRARLERFSWETAAGRIAELHRELQPRE